MTLGVTTHAIFFSLVALFMTSGSFAAKYLHHPDQRVRVNTAVYTGKSSATNISTLSKRWDGSPAMGRELHDANGKACALWPMMHLDDAKAGQMFTPPRALAHSDFLQLDDLTRWGYVPKLPMRHPKCDMDNGKDMYGLQAFLEAKGMSAEKKDWKCVRITHGDPEHKTTNIDDQTYANPRTGHTVRVTGALYQFAINAKDGVIVIAKQYSAAHQSQYRRPPVQAPALPDLRSSSDITWLAWKPYHDKGVKLHHIITWSVTNGATQRLVAAAIEAASDESLRDADKALRPYPWVGWTADQTPGSLILGSPNGVGIGYLLVQHKPELGNRRVRNIEVFLADTGASNLHEPSIAWEVEDAPAM
ncbi:uncharacterized protein EKO05_0005255 [Ascochyta rabiei]|uniref:Uncharacterized protein n=1 Tax=Didymella rabiei TaxID=5454 RepID=A0A163L524_DIDRA|nr:uncharacterized protein EKO05_0005255 [Ascochyta rabiei]KZM27505.1 hypothetical protein ST47_g1372 [Ascochyta rabiei]UPX14783.1 hypothetical protein EKO05_0005255 [Ascochyta rabiei]